MSEPDADGFDPAACSHVRRDWRHNQRQYRVEAFCLDCGTVGSWVADEMLDRIQGDLPEQFQVPWRIFWGLPV